MLGRLLLVLMMMAAPSLVAAQEYDDPAIVVCELVIRAHEAASADFRQVEASIIGAKAMVKYERTILGAKPAIETATCPYRLDGDVYVLDFYTSPATEECRVKIDTFQPIIQRGFSTAEQADEIMPQVYECQDIDEAARSRANDTLDPARQELYSSGLYPIAKSATTLQ